MKFYTHMPPADTQPADRIYTLKNKTFCIEVDPVDRKGYRARAETATLGALMLARIYTTSAVVSRKHEECMDPAYKRFSLVYAIEGELIISHHRGMSTLKAGEFTLMDNSHPRKMLVKNRVSLFLVSIPQPVLKRYIPVPEMFIGMTMRAAGDTNSEEDPAFASLLAMWEKLKNGSLREFAPSLSGNFLSLVARMYGSQHSNLSSTAIRRITEVKQTIEAQLGNPQLSVETIAAGMGLTSRYLRGLFQGSEKISNHILRRRLEECAFLLNNPLCQHNSIVSIAFQFGFSSAAHFSRAFRKQFGCTPSDCRKQKAGGRSITKEPQAPVLSHDAIHLQPGELRQ